MTKHVGDLWSQALSLNAAQRPKDVEAVCREILEINSTHADAVHLLGLVCCQLGRREEGTAFLETSSRLQPGNPAFALNLGHAYALANRGDEAVAILERTIQANQNFMPARLKLGQIHRKHMQMHASAACFRSVIQADPSSCEAWLGLGDVMNAVGRTEDGLAALHRAVALAPQDPIPAECLLWNLLCDPRETGESLLKAHRDWALKHEGRWPELDLGLERDPEIRLRIGYLSPDFRRHSCAFFAEPLFEHHDRGNVELFAYADVVEPDFVTSRFEAKSDHWRNIRGLSDEAVAEQIRADRIHVLVDLAGHTGRNRLQAIARRPAPIRMTYLGYPATTGLDSMGCRITDVIADPEGYEAHASEQLIRLPRPFLAYGPPLDAPEVVEPPSLSAGFITFGSFNNFAKVNGNVIARWAEILGAVPHSKLFLKGAVFGDRAMCDEVRGRFDCLGVAAERLDLRAWVFGEGSPLAPYREVDIALDPFPYNGTTTTCEALWMGVPVISLKGGHHVARVGLSLLSAVDLLELVADSETDYVRIAVELAQDAARLKALRHSLRGRMAASKLCDPKDMAQALEAEYRRLWRWHCEPLGSVTESP